MPLLEINDLKFISLCRRRHAVYNGKQYHQNVHVLLSLTNSIFFSRGWTVSVDLLFPVVRKIFQWNSGLVLAFPKLISHAVDDVRTPRPSLYSKNDVKPNDYEKWMNTLGYCSKTLWCSWTACRRLILQRTKLSQP